MEKKTLITVAVIAVSVFAATVWPTAYSTYVLRQGNHQVIVRINRFTGETHMFRAGHWSTINTTDDDEAGDDTPVATPVPVQAPMSARFPPPR